MFNGVQVNLVVAIAHDTHAKDEYCYSSSVRSSFFFFNFFTSGLHLQLTLMAATEYLILRLATDRVSLKPSKRVSSCCSGGH